MKSLSILPACAALAVAGCCACPKGVQVADFGVTQYGEKAKLYTLQGAGGLRLDVTDDGGKIVRIFAPDRDGNLADVTLGFDDPSGWEKTNPYFGALIGRYANRIADAHFAIDGTEYKLTANEAAMNATLHGGTRGWDQHVWTAEPKMTCEGPSLVLSRTSPDGEEGFPGTVDVKVTYTVTKDNVWRIEYEATTDKPTVINMTQHTYFNLDGEGNILNHELQIPADTFLAVDNHLAPLPGPAMSVEGTPYDFRDFHTVGERIDTPEWVAKFGKGYDLNWCPNGSGFRKVATLRGKTREMEVWSDQPGLQFYTGDLIKNEWTMKDGKSMAFRGALALETQLFPNTPNRPDFGSAVLRPGETYKTVTEYRFKAR